MTSLAGQIDRFSHNTKAIKATAETTAISTPSGFHIPGPFTSAVLNTHLGDLIRDIDSSELGLFNLTTPAPSNFGDQNAQGTPATGVTRTEFPAPTPLRKPAYQRDIPKANDIDPEIYARAAWKYIDRYQTIRPMPRAHSQVNGILERLGVVRINIQNLSDLLHQTQSTGHISSKKLTEDEDNRIHSLQSRAAQLKKRKQAALAQYNASSGSRKSPNMPKPEAAPLASPHEDKFWNTPARTLRFTDNLMDEEMEAGDISEISLRNSKPPSTPSCQSVSPRSDIEQHSEDALGNTSGVTSFQALCEIDAQLDKSTVSDLNREKERTEQQNHVFEVDDDNPTVRNMRLGSHPSSVVVMDADLVSPMQGPSPYGSPGTKVKVNSEVERIVARIWATAGDVIMPGHPFDTTAHGNKPPRGKETIAHLQSLSIQSPSPISPSPSSISSASSGVPAAPTSQQVLTAYLLLLLLTSPPYFSMPLNRAKDLLASKAKGSSRSMSMGQSATRILYGCVAKRLIKIERGGGEQIVRFDI